MKRILLPAVAGILVLSVVSGQAQTGPYGVGENGLGGTHASPVTQAPSRSTIDTLSNINPSAGPSSSNSSGTPLDKIPGSSTRRSDRNTDPIATMPRLDDFPNGR